MWKTLPLGKMGGAVVEAIIDQPVFGFLRQISKTATGFLPAACQRRSDATC